ncbi:hypothetical protein ACSQ67_025679 [Phaseolus vulgaris]
MAKNTRIKDMQANVKRVTEAPTNHSTQLLKVDQTFEALRTLLQGHNDRFVKVKQALGLYFIVATSTRRRNHFSVAPLRWVELSVQRGFPSSIFGVAAPTSHDRRYA